ncbi:MAG: phosphatidate cytidylyltransferase [Chitinophagaceae bacterium]
MKRKFVLSQIIMLVFLSASVSSCEAIGGIFKAGVWSGVLLVVGLIALVIFIISRLGGKK